MLIVDHSCYSAIYLYNFAIAEIGDVAGDALVACHFSFAAVTAAVAAEAIDYFVLADFVLVDRSG